MKRSCRSVPETTSLKAYIIGTEWGSPLHKVGGMNAWIRAKLAKPSSHSLLDHYAKLILCRNQMVSRYPFFCGRMRGLPKAFCRFSKLRKVISMHFILGCFVIESMTRPLWLGRTVHIVCVETCLSYRTKTCQQQ